MNGSAHYLRAEQLLSGDPFDQRAAQVHATLALVVAIREVGDQLDTLPRPQAQPTSGSSSQLLCGEPTDWPGVPCGLFGGHPGQYFPQSSSDE